MSLYNKQPITSGGFDNQSFLVVRNEKSRKARVGRLNQANPDRSIPVGLACTVLNYGLSVELNRQCGAVSGLAEGTTVGDTTGFSRWYFNFTAKTIHSHFL